MKRKIPEPEELLTAIDRVIGDGFCPTESLFYEFSGRTRRDIAAGLERATRSGYLLDRRGPGGRRFVAISSEGWALIRSAAG